MVLTEVVLSWSPLLLLAVLVFFLPRMAAARGRSPTPFIVIGLIPGLNLLALLALACMKLEGQADR